MTTIDRFDPFERRISEAIDEIAAARRPDYLDDIFRLTARTSQRRSRSFPERLMNVNGFRLATVGVAGIVAAVALASLVFKGTVGPSQSPNAPSPSPSFSATSSVGLDLRGDWLGAHHDIQALDTEAGAHLAITAAALAITQSNHWPNAVFSLTAGTTSDGKLELRGPGAPGDAGCGDARPGTYDVALSPSGETLTITALADDCAGRSRAVAGTWWRSDCKNGPCYGNIDPGTYGTEYFLPGMQVAADWAPTYGALGFTTTTAWAVAADGPNRVHLVRQDVFARWTADGPPEGDGAGILVFAQPVVMKNPRTCPSEATVDEAAGRSVAELIAALEANPDIETSGLAGITVGGRSGKVVDLRLSPSATVSCWGSTPAQEFLMSPLALDFDWYSLGLTGSQRTRLILLDLGPSSVLGVAIQASESGWDAMLDEATPIVDSFTFE